MYVIREILNCQPGHVRPMVERFRTLSTAFQAMGRPPLRLLTDVSGEPFWTLVVEATVDKVDDFFEMERRVMADESIRKEMAGFHDLLQRGRREIYRIEQ